MLDFNSLKRIVFTIIDKTFTLCRINTRSVFFWHQVDGFHINRTAIVGLDGIQMHKSINSWIIASGMLCFKVLKWYHQRIIF